MFHKVDHLEISRNSLLNGVAGLQPTEMLIKMNSSPNFSQYFENLGKFSGIAM